MSLKYGFFDAHRTTSEVDGQQVVTFDRTYTVNDWNSFFRYVVTQYGVFLKSGGSYMYNGNLTYQHCKIQYDLDRQDVDDDEDIETPSVTRTIAHVLPGKGLIAGHWFEIESIEDVYLPDADAQTKTYGIFVKYDENNRTISLSYSQLSSHTNVVPMGYNRTTKTFSVTDDGLCELYLGAVEVYGIGTREYRAGQIGRVINHIGESTCPYISHLVYDTGKADADEYVRQYQDQVNAWIQEIKETNGFNPSVSMLRINYGLDGKRHGPTLDITYDLYKRWNNAYRYDSADQIMAYYNGLFLIQDIDYTITQESRGSAPDSSSTPGLHTIFNMNRNGSISENDVLSIVIIRSKTVPIPNGNNIKY